MLQSLPSTSLWIVSILNCALLISSSAYANPQERPPMPVPVIAAQPSEAPYLQNFPVRLQALKDVEVHARLTATIEEQAYTEGSFVKKGQLLYRLDDRRAKAAHAMAQANLATAKVRAEQAEVTYKRTQKLAAKRSVSEQAVDDALAAWQTANTELQAAEAQLKSAQIELDDTTIEAEISGIIGARQQDVGDLVNPLTGNTLLNRIRQTDQLYGLFSVSDRDRQTRFALAAQNLLKLETPPKIELLDSQGQALVTGLLDFADSQIDLATSSQLYRAKFDNSQQTLLPGQLMRVAVQFGTWQNVIAIPQKAVIQNGNQAFVYVAADGKAQMRPVTLAGAYQKQWLISSGLSAGEQVIVGNIIKLRPNSAIQILPPAEDSKNPVNAQ